MHLFICPLRTLLCFFCVDPQQASSTLSALSGPLLYEFAVSDIDYLLLSLKCLSFLIVLVLQLFDFDTN